MHAKITKPEQQNGKNYSGDKELINAYSVVGKVKGELMEVVTVRSYMGRSSSASVVYCSIWIHGNGYYMAGSGNAGGYGYHKESAALQSAINSAGITLYGSPYADQDGMHYIDVPNPEFSTEALDAAFAESDEAGKAYAWRTPKRMRKLVKDTGKNVAHIGGCGDSAMKSAMLAIARCIGAKGKLLIVNH